MLLKLSLLFSNALPVGSYLYSIKFKNLRVTIIYPTQYHVSLTL